MYISFKPNIKEVIKELKIVKLPLIRIQGNPRERGLQHGKQLAERIDKTIQYYKGIFNREDTEIFDAARIYADVIRNFKEEYAIEIEAIAEGAGVHPLWIYALNSRTEILTQFVVDAASITECTAVLFTKAKLLSQTWDWASALEELFVMMHITREDGHKILQVTEPGIIGKIGINSCGLGVTLNFLHMDRKLNGLPIHITLRHFLDSTSLERGMDTLGEYQYGKSSNVIFASKSGEFINLEFADDKVFSSSKGDLFVHTNHFLQSPELNTDEEKIASSRSRYARATELTDQLEQNMESVKKLLGDTNNELPICRKYLPHEDIGDSGTVTAIIMNLEKGQIHATPGNPFENEYKVFEL